MINRAMMMLFVSLVLLAMVQTGPTLAEGALPAAVEAGIRVQLAKAEGRRGTAGFVVRDLDSGAVLMSHNPHSALIPASNMKLVTSLAALELLGADFEYVTRVLGRGSIHGGALHGDLCVFGGGDPNLSGRFHDGDNLALFRTWAAALKGRGITRVTGDLQYDSTIYGGEAYCEGWPGDDQYVRWYCAQVSALAFNDNCIGIKVTPTRAGKPAKIETIPPTNYVTIVNETTTVPGRKGAEIGIVRPRDSNVITVKGRVYEQATWGYSVDVTVHDPARFAATVLRETLMSEGIRVEGSVKPVTLTGEQFSAATSLVEHRSKLTTALKPINTNSQNLHAEMLLRQLGLQYTGKGTFKTGCAAVKDFLEQRKLLTEGMELVDGSGLAAGNRITASMLSAMLQRAGDKPYFDTFKDSLAAAGEGTLERRLKDPGLKDRLFAKTGYINNVRALSGYLVGGKRRLTFSILMNNCVYSRECQDEIIKLLAKA